jgi:phosphopantetheine adenylyltransferase
MLLKELFLKEDDQSTAVFAFGRFNPPTKGHEKLIQRVRSVAQKMDAKPYLFVTHSVDKKNPLTHQERVDYIKSTGRFNDIEVGDADVKTIVQALQKLMNEGRTRVIIVAGSDRVDYFKNFMNQYNKKNDKAGNLVFDFDYVDAVSSGERDPDADGVEGFSASQARAYAGNDDFENFTKVIMDNDQAKIKEIFDKVQSKVGKQVALNNEKLYNEDDMAKKQPVIYLDMDGVIADFFGGVEKMYGVKHWKELTSKKSGGELKQEVIDRITGSDFFSTLPKFPNADALIQLIKSATGGKFSILTSPLRGDHENSATQKKVWIAKNIERPDEVIVSGRKEKWAKQKDGTPNILIDDRPVNIERWEAKGGFGILYQANRDSIIKVQQELNKYGETHGNQ